MFGHKFLICATLLMWSSSALSQSQTLNLKDAQFPASEEPMLSSSKQTTSTSSPSTSTTTTPKTTSTTTTTTTTVKPPTTTTTTTAAPPTTTPAPISTTTHKPKPYPPPSVGSWNCSCIMITMAAQMNFTYETKSGNNATGLFNLPSNATVDHYECDNNITQSIQLNWNTTNFIDSMTLWFEKQNHSVSLTTMKININLSTDDYPDAKENQSIQLLRRTRFTDFKTPENMSYHCTRVEKFNMTETLSNNHTVGDITVSHVQVEAFRTSNTTGFSAVHDCDSSETSDVVPIAVGIALAALIIVVLISYLCARRRSTSRGYMSF